MKQVLALVVLVLLLGGAAVGGLAFLGIAPFDSLLPQPGAPPQEAAAEEEPDDGVREIPLGTIGVPVIVDGDIAARVFISVDARVPVSRHTEVRRQLAVLHDAYLSDLMAFLPAHMENRELPDHRVVRQRLETVTEKVLGPGLVKEILIRGIFRR